MQKWNIEVSIDGPLRTHAVSVRVSDARSLSFEPTGMTLPVIADGHRVLLYHAANSGNPQGKECRTLIDQRAVCVHISQPVERPDLAGVITYLRPDVPNRQTQM